MLTEMRNSLQMAWEQVFKLKTAVFPLLSADEEKALSWAKVIESYAAVPPVYQDFFEPFLAEGRIFPYTVLTPSFEGFLHQTTEKLICDFGNAIYILERGGKTFAVECYPYKGISYVEIGTILLNAWIKISGVTTRGVLTSSTFRFNSVTNRLFTPMLARVRFAPTDDGGTVLSSELEKFNQFMRLNYKFMNYARLSLVGGEKVMCVVLQPEIRVGLLTLMGKTFYRNISPTHMSILTDRELIMIQESERWVGGAKYGGRWDYIPLNKIVSLSLREKDNDLLELSIHLPEGTRLEFLFQASMGREINLLVEQFRRLTPRGADWGDREYNGRPSAEMG